MAACIHKNGARSFGSSHAWDNVRAQSKFWGAPSGPFRAPRHVTVLNRSFESFLALTLTWPRVPRGQRPLLLQKRPTLFPLQCLPLAVTPKYNDFITVFVHLSWALELQGWRCFVIHGLIRNGP